LNANDGQNRETIALLPIFDKKLHKHVSKSRRRELKKLLFLKCIKVIFILRWISNFQVVISPLLPKRWKDAREPHDFGNGEHRLVYFALSTWIAGKYPCLSISAPRAPFICLWFPLY